MFFRVLNDGFHRGKKSGLMHVVKYSPENGHLKFRRPDSWTFKIPQTHEVETFADAERDIDDWFDYYNNDRYQWQLAKLSPRQYYLYVTTGEYPLPGEPPKIGDPRGSAP